MAYYNFNPDLAEPYKLIHPLQLKYIYKFNQLIIPDEVKSVILFGGSLQLYCNEFSDLDLYVVVKNDDIDVLEKVQNEMYWQCATLGKHCDILVASEAEYNLWRDEKDSVTWNADNNGVVIYGETQI